MSNGWWWVWLRKFVDLPFMRMESRTHLGFKRGIIKSMLNPKRIKREKKKKRKEKQKMKKKEKRRKKRKSLCLPKSFQDGSSIEEKGSILLPT